MSKPKNKRSRNANYDLMRIIMFLFVVGLHTPNCEKLGGNTLLHNAIYIILYQCNAIFFMISGTFNIGREFNDAKDYLKYYAKRVQTVILPYILVFAIIMFAEHHVHRGDMALSDYFVFLGKALVQDDVYSHLWFLYTLVGFMLSTPFLAKMFSAMKDSEVRVLGISILIWNFVSIYLCTDIGLSFGVSGWLFSGWIWAYLAGYILNRLELDRYEAPIYILGIIGYVVTVYGNTYIAGFAYPADLSVGFLLFSIAGFCFMKKRIKIENEKLAGVISFLGKHTFTSYILHIYVMGHLTNRIVESDTGVREWILSILITFVSSLGVAGVMDKLIVENVQKLIRYATGKR